MEKEITVKTLNLTKQYKNKCAVDSVSLTIQKGEIYGLVGKNGAGKTTLIRLLCGVIHSTAGSYSLFGFDKEKDLLKVRQKVAAMIETPSLYLNLSAEDNLKARCILMHKDFSIIKSRLMEVGLKDVIGSRKKVKDFSLGMRQRLGIAISILGDPELLILDEPTNGLDPEGIKEMRDLLVSLNQNRGVTIIVSSHILSELSKFATKYGFMDKGKIIKEISSDELFRSCKKSLDIELKTQNDLQKMTP